MRTDGDTDADWI